MGRVKKKSRKISNLLIATSIFLLSFIVYFQCTTRSIDATIGFVGPDILFEENKLPEIPANKEWQARAWKGEKVHTQMVIHAAEPLEKTRLVWSDLKDGSGNIISADHIKANFIRYVMADGFDAKTSRCSLKQKQDSTVVADIIDNADFMDLAENSVQPVWLSVSVPQNSVPGIYHGTIVAAVGNRKSGRLNFSIEVADRTLPAPRDWKFHLDLWQNPDAIARVHQVEMWSEEYMRILEPYMKMLADAGQKVITAALIHDPWNSQTRDVYSTMIKWTKQKDGSWSYDYTIFDKWVSFVHSVGIDGLIECYSMIPWNLKFHYFDEALRKDTLIVAEPGSREYEAHWKPMLTDFARHLKEKGWFEKTTIAMDERPMDAMQKAIAVIRSADKDFKISLAGDYHPEIEADLFDYCLASKFQIDRDVLERRKSEGKITTFYTCCVEEYPNTFTISPPAEAAWLGWHAAYKGYDGYLRWAYNSWPENPLQDSRFGNWASGDTYLVYPGPRSSIRFERLIEGIQDFEKISILMEEYQRGTNLNKLRELDGVLADFEIESLKTLAAGTMIENARKRLF
jgi:hypothetical protein